MLYTNIQPQSFLCSTEGAFKCVLPHMGMAAILFSGTKPLKQIFNTPSTEGPILNLGKFVKRFQRILLRLHNFIHVCTRGTKC